MPRLSPAIFIAILLSLVAAFATQGATRASIVVKDGNWKEIWGGSTQDFGSLRLDQTLGMPLNLQNSGEQDLYVHAVTVIGENPQDFVISEGLTNFRVGFYDNKRFGVRFVPTAIGRRAAMLQIRSNVGTFTLNLTGEGSLPELRVDKADGDELLAGTILDLGSRLTSITTPVTSTFAIKNLGQGALVVSSISVSGPHASDFTITSPAKGAARPGQNLPLVIEFRTGGYGTRTAKVKILNDDADEGAFEFTLTGFGHQSDFRIEYIENRPLVHDEIFNFGIAGANEPTGVSRTFTIKNPGDLPLTLSFYGNGVYSENYTVTSPPQSPVQPGQSTTMIIRFRATAGDHNHMMRLSIRHNASPHGAATFSMELRGYAGRSNVDFAEATYQCLHGDTQALVKLTRDAPHIPGFVTLHTLAGVNQSLPPFKAAMPDVDFPKQPEVGYRVEFAAGEKDKMVAVPLLAPASGAKVNRHMVLKLTAGVHTSTWNLPKATLRILGADNVKPSVTLSTPAAGKMGVILPFVVSGRAGDATGIERVEVKVGSADPVLATLGTLSSNLSVPFTCEVSPPNGTQDLVVTAYDLRGNSTSVTRSITLTRHRRLTLADQHNTRISLALASGNPVVPLRNTAYSERQWSVEPGTRLKLSITIGAGCVFDRWFLNPAPNDAQGSESTVLGSDFWFSMPEEDLKIIPWLSNVPFDPPPGQSRNLYWPLTTDPDASPPTFTASLSGTLNGSGSFSGRLLIEGQSVPVAATLYHSQQAVFTVAGKKLPSLPCPGGELTIAAASGAFKAFVTPVASSLATISGYPRRAAHSATNKVSPELLNSASKGSYTLRFSPPASETSPQIAAQGYATINLTSTGSITLAGMLADGTPLTMSTEMLGNEEAFLFVQLPTPGATTKLGRLAGLLRFDAGDTDSDVTAMLTWHRPAAASPKVLLYPAGWPQGIWLDSVGALYSPTKTLQQLLFPGLPPNTTSPARLYFTGGKLTGPIEKTNFGLKGNTVVKTAPADGSYTLTIAPTTGVFSGTFTGMFMPNLINPVSAKPAFKGVILQKGIIGSAAGFFINNAKGETAPESGAVTLGAPQE